jgi:hypothetical protein
MNRRPNVLSSSATAYVRCVGTVAPKYLLASCGSPPHPASAPIHSFSVSLYNSSPLILSRAFLPLSLSLHACKDSSADCCSMGRGGCGREELYSGSAYARPWAEKLLLRATRPRPAAHRRSPTWPGGAAGPLLPCGRRRVPFLARHRHDRRSLRPETSAPRVGWHPWSHGEAPTVVRGGAPRGQGPSSPAAEGAPGGLHREQQQVQCMYVQCMYVASVYFGCSRGSEGMLQVFLH